MMIILKHGAPPIRKIHTPLKNGFGHLSERWAAWLCHASLATSRQCLGTAFTQGFPSKQVVVVNHQGSSQRWPHQPLHLHPHHHYKWLQDHSDAVCQRGRSWYPVGHSMVPPPKWWQQLSGQVKFTMFILTLFDGTKFGPTIATMALRVGGRKYTIELSWCTSTQVVFLNAIINRSSLGFST